MHLTAKQRALIADAAANAFDRAVENFDATPIAKQMNARQHSKALKLIAAKVTLEMHKFAASLNW
jgi:hypothetical protein